ncbi:uncharacterized protein LOC116840534 [Odontomachus brunneus]|uniref:uncharacterized protein LOC116840534 n=1 Tax=Odontomachus brunneus TaxID=486640 RepID=UPI0013F2574B|nr:uncharacterized protein LOC116840534 [Odontomachus brunneus]
MYVRMREQGRTRSSQREEAGRRISGRKKISFRPSLQKRKDTREHTYEFVSLASEMEVGHHRTVSRMSTVDRVKGPHRSRDTSTKRSEISFSTVACDERRDAVLGTFPRVVDYNVLQIQHPVAQRITSMYNKAIGCAEGNPRGLFHGDTPGHQETIEELSHIETIVEWTSTFGMSINNTRGRLKYEENLRRHCQTFADFYYRDRENLGRTSVVKDLTGRWIATRKDLVVARSLSGFLLASSHRDNPFGTR